MDEKIYWKGEKKKGKKKGIDIVGMGEEKIDG